MFLRWGGYSHSTAEAAIAISRENVLNDGGQIYSFREVWNIQGKLLGDGTQATMDTLCAALKTAYAIQNQVLALVLDSGSVSNHFLTPVGSLTGTRVTRAPSFPQNAGAEMVNFRSYEITVEAEYAYPSMRDVLLSFQETLTFEGGGPAFMHHQPVEGLPIKEMLFDQTPYKVTQAGSAVGFTRYPLPAPPLFPGDFVHAPQITRTSPKRRGIEYTDWPITWRYDFEAATELIGQPTIWR